MSMSQENVFKTMQCISAIDETFPWSRIHYWTISLRFLGIILRVLRLQVSVYKYYFTNSFQITFFCSRGEGGNPLVEVTVNSKEENSWDVCPNYVQEFGLWVMFEHSVRVLWAELLFISEYKQPCTNCVYKCTIIYQNTTSICTREQ